MERWSVSLAARDIEIGRGESIQDTARVLSRYVDGIMLRTFEHTSIVEPATPPCRSSTA